ncbi:MAG: hypothetical protein HW421_1243 [Ignavibacteria bacterium]|nr:hypothetical protein [Ignavibacteria bacterium]
MKKPEKKIVLILLMLVGILFIRNDMFAQIEDVPVTHPVYNFLQRMQTRGFLPHFSLSQLPLQRKDVLTALNKIKLNNQSLEENELNSQLHFEKEFGISTSEKAVVFYSSSDSTQVFSKKMFQETDKFIYRLLDSAKSVFVRPLGSIDYFFKDSSFNQSNSTLATLGVRLYGSLGSHFGYYFQATNGRLFGGSRSLALEDNHLNRNIKFTYLNSDVDFSESHIRYEYDWFYAKIGRETQLIGSGLNHHLVVSDNSNPFDAITLGCKFQGFEYRYIYGSLLGLPNSTNQTGAGLQIPPKYFVFHRFALRPEWGEISFWENIIYSERSFDLGYLNPLSFFKSIEHALHDRDNASMGLDWTVVPFSGLAVKGTFYLDDIIFEKIGKGFWANKMAWNIALIAALPYSIDLAAEYARVEPYTFSHFNPQNAYSNDKISIGSYLPPNSDEFLMKTQWWFGGRYPLYAVYSYNRHGDNIYNNYGVLTKNVGGRIDQTKRDIDSMSVTFLEGNLIKKSALEIGGGIELIKGFSFHASLNYTKMNNGSSIGGHLNLRFEDF